MTPDTTSPWKGGMDCARVAQEEILDGYLLGKLSEEDRDAFEEHYFGCATCFDALQTVRAARDELARVGTYPDVRTRRFFPWGAVAAFGAAAMITFVFPQWIYHVSPAPHSTAEQSASSRPQSEQTGSQSRETNGRTEPAVEQKPRRGEASRVPVSVPVLPAPPIPPLPTPQPSNQSGSPGGLPAEPSLGGPAEAHARAPIGAAEQAKEAIGQLVNNYCSALESLQPARVRSLFRVDNERELKAKFKEFTSLRCTVMAPPEYMDLDAGPAGSALIEFEMKQVIKMASAGAPATQETIVTMVVSHRDSQSPWLIDRVTYQLKAK